MDFDSQSKIVTCKAVGKLPEVGRWVGGGHLSLRSATEASPQEPSAPCWVRISRSPLSIPAGGGGCSSLCCTLSL